jgi:hypothetical protein
MPKAQTKDNYGDELRRIREALRLRQDEFATLLGTGVYSVSRYELGTSHVPEPTMRLARALYAQQATGIAVVPTVRSGRTPRVTTSQRAQICALRAEGHSAEAIAQMFQLSLRTVYRVLKHQAESVGVN